MKTTKELFNEFIKIDLDPFLKDEGYQAKGHSYLKNKNKIGNIVSFQLGSYSFTINLGVHFPEFNNYLLNDYMKDPKAAEECPLQSRISRFANEEKWWTLFHIKENIDLNKLSEDVFIYFKKYAPGFFENFKDYHRAFVVEMHNKFDSVIWDDQNIFDKVDTKNLKILIPEE